MQTSQFDLRIDIPVQALVFAFSTDMSIPSTYVHDERSKLCCSAWLSEHECAGSDRGERQQYSNMPASSGIEVRVPPKYKGGHDAHPAHRSGNILVITVSRYLKCMTPE